MNAPGALAAPAGAGGRVPGRFVRSRSTLLAYGLLAFYGYFLNALGPVTPFLRAELHLSYTAAGWHFTAFAVGILVAGLTSQRVAGRLGRGRALRLAVGGVSAGCLLLAAGRSAAVTIGGTLIMGAVGSILLAVVNSALSDEHGARRAVALSEANLLASAVGALAGVAVSSAAGTPLGWRGGLLVPLLAAPPLFLASRDAAIAAPRAAPPAGRAGRLPATFWALWLAVVTAVSVEFCLLFWAGDFATDVLHLPRGRAALAPSVFLCGMLLGRLAGSRLVRRVAEATLIQGSLALAALGFLAYWRAPGTAVALAGLLASGLGVASLYPFVVALALATTAATDAAAARVTLASGVAIASLPLALARLADAIGLRRAHALVLVLAGATSLLVWGAGRLRPGARRAGGARGARDHPP